MIEKYIKFQDLSTADLDLNCVYEGGTKGNAGDDPLSPLLRCGNQGGFRISGSIEKGLNYVVLYSSQFNPDWPDKIDNGAGTVIYYGDNKEPEQDFLNTKKKGNIILEKCFDSLIQNERKSIPPIFLFIKGTKGRDVIFKGLLVPGTGFNKNSEDLVKVSRFKKEQKFENYRATFTILDVSRINRRWINELQSGNKLGENAPKEWIEWVETGIYKPFKMEANKNSITKEEQIPQNDEDIRLVEQLKEHFYDSVKFNRCATAILKLMDSNILSFNFSDSWIDNMKDITGKYKVGTENNTVVINFALEVVNNEPNHAVGLIEVSRLLSRMKYREFGILFTTSFLEPHIYTELMKNNHPIIVVSAQEIVKTLKANGINSANTLQKWLKQEF
jgi:hypothetical protein